MQRLFRIILLLFIFITYASQAFAYYEINPEMQNVFSDYMTNVKNIIQQNWTAPDCIVDGNVNIIFSLDREGYITSAKITKSSGNKIFDESAIYALQKSEPFGNFPLNCNKNSITIHYIFDSSIVNPNSINKFIKLYEIYTLQKDFNSALNYINQAINEAGNNDKYYFLYKQKADAETKIGLSEEAKKDIFKYNELKKIHDVKRIHFVKHFAEIENSPFAYFYLAYCYEQIQDYPNAIKTIDKAISMTTLNNQYKRYKTELEKHLR